MFSASDQTPTCRADQKIRSNVVSNKTLVGGLEAGKFSFAGVVRYFKIKQQSWTSCPIHPKLSEIVSRTLLLNDARYVIGVRLIRR